MAVFNFRDFFSDSRWGGIFSKPLSLGNNNFWENAILNQKSATIIDWNNLLSVYQMCSPLQEVLSKKAEMLSNGELKLRKKSDKKNFIDKHWSLDLLKNPNPLQAQREFVYEWSLYNDIYSNNFIYSNKPFPTSSPKTLTNLPSGYMQINKTGKWLDQITLSGMIESYELRNFGMVTSRIFTTDEVKHTNNGISKDVFKSDSKMIALQMPISNIIAAYKTRNNLITENAGITIISSESKDTMGSIPMSDEAKKRVDTDFKNSYGLRNDQMHKIISSSPLKVTPLIFPVRDMMLSEEIEEGLQQICGTYGVDRDVLPSSKGATFENKKAGEISTYTGVIQTTANSFCNFLDLLLLSNENDLEFFMDYSHLYCMQEDQLNAGKTTLYEVQAMQLLYHNGIIDAQTFADFCEVDFTGDGIVKTSVAPAADPNASDTPIK